ncbi:MAG TPA: GNVR domain-containing protein [Geminicoccaceae bacterium]|mgnify:CR=1 FL=1|nr:GNVR domain-containing protein [Geminicoccus sp.]HMU51627.1 GNVR domain-containing protein [Geminicoccaceae bacterium]
MDVHPQSNLAWGNGLAEQKIELREILLKLWRGRRPIFFTILVGSLIGYLAIRALPTIYKASSTVMLDSRHMKVVQSDEILANLTTEPEAIEGEIERLRSRELAGEVVRRLKLDNDPEFNPQLSNNDDGFNWNALIRYLPADFAAHAHELLHRSDDGAAAMTDEGAATRVQKDIVDAYLSGLDVRQVGKSPAIEIRFSSSDPVTAAAVANAVAETYIGSLLGTKSDATRRAGEWLGDRIAQLRAEVEQKERAVEEFRARNGLIAGRDLPLQTQEMAELATQLVAARVERQSAESRLQQARRTNGSSVGFGGLESEVVKSLRVQEAELSREVVELSSELGPMHPRLVNARAKLQDVRASIAGETRNITAGMRNEAEAARQREASIQASVDQLTGRVAQNNAKAVELRTMEREVEASRVLLESLLARQQETAQQEGIQQADAKILSRAAVPDSPSFPNKKLFMALALLASAFGGVSLAYVLQALDETFQTADQVSRDLDMPVLEVVPLVKGLRRQHSPADWIVMGPNSSFAEAIRQLHVSLMAHRSVLFTSTLPDEGKTSLACAFGRFLAGAGRSVVLIDCDLRRSSVHQVLRGREGPGLVDHLTGGAELDRIIQRDEQSRLHFIAAGSMADHPPDLFLSRQMRTMVSVLTRVYDTVLIDSAPVLAVADTRCLQPLVEQTVFVVRWRSTQRAKAREAVRRLNLDGASPAGAVLNMIDPSAYGEYDAGYGYQAVKRYYGE